MDTGHAVCLCLERLKEGERDDGEHFARRVLCAKHWMLFLQALSTPVDAAANPTRESPQASGHQLGTRWTPRMLSALEAVDLLGECCGP